MAELKAGGGEDDIARNMAVDVLARGAAQQYSANPTRQALATYRLQLTKHVQDMMVEFWRAERKDLQNTNLQKDHESVEVHMDHDLVDALLHIESTNTLPLDMNDDYHNFNCETFEGHDDDIDDFEYAEFLLSRRSK